MLLAQKFRTFDGAWQRMRFENAIAFDRARREGATFHRFTVIPCHLDGTPMDADDALGRRFPKCYRLKREVAVLNHINAEAIATAGSNRR